MDSILQFQCLPFNQLEEIRETKQFLFQIRGSTHCAENIYFALIYSFGIILLCALLFTFLHLYLLETFIYTRENFIPIL